MNVAMFYGTSFDRDSYKERFIDNFPDDWNVFVANRFRSLNVKERKNINAFHIYDHPIFKKSVTQTEISDAEKWLRVSFLHIFRCWIFWKKSLETRKHLAGIFECMAKYVTFWKDFFSSNRIDVYIANLESTYPEIIALEVAKILGIKIVNSGSGRFTNTYMIYDSEFMPVYLDRVNKVEEARIWELLKEKYSSKKHAENLHIKKDALEYGSIQKPLRKFSAFLRYFRNYHSAHECDKYRTIPPSELFSDIIRRIIRKHYAKKFFRNEDYHKIPYFFFPLQYQTEAAMTYLNHFIDQFDLVQKTSECLPPGTKLIVKPHAHWRCTDIPIGKIKEMSKNPNIIIVDPDSDTYDLIRNSIAVVTINSTVGIEALIMDKPVVVFGYGYAEFADEKIAHVVRRIEKLPLILKRIADQKFKTNGGEVIRFVSTYYKNLIQLKSRFGLDQKMSDEDAGIILKRICEYVAFLDKKR